jgi:hypothetical protein
VDPRISHSSPSVRSDSSCNDLGSKKLQLARTKSEYALTSLCHSLTMPAKEICLSG